MSAAAPLPDKPDTGQAADQTTVSLFSPKILVYISLAITRSDYKPVHGAQLKKSSLNSQRFKWRSISSELGNRNHVILYLVNLDAICQKLSGTS